jgi:hypothetical protein
MLIVGAYEKDTHAAREKRGKAIYWPSTGGVGLAYRVSLDAGRLHGLPFRLLLPSLLHHTTKLIGGFFPIPPLVSFWPRQRKPLQKTHNKSKSL